MNREQSSQSNSMDALAARLARLSPQKRAILEKRLLQQAAQKTKQEAATDIISRLSDRESAPLSSSQQRVWFLDQLQPNTATYNMAVALRLVGDLNIDALQQTLDAITERHEALRTVFRKVDGKPVQIVRAASPLELSIVDAKTWPRDKKEIKIQHYLNEQANRPFDLACDPLLRGTLLKLADDKHILLLVLHHIVSDGWSMGILTRDLNALYNAFSEGKPSPLSPLPIQYIDFASWQQQWLTGDRLETQLNYWQGELSGAPSLLDLPTDRPRPAVQGHRGARQDFQINQTITSGLTALSQQCGATLYMTLLAALSVLLFRYSGQEDIMIGSPIFNRNRQDIESIIGFFANTLVMRSRLQGNPRFAELLQRVKKTALGAYAHKDIPFEHLVSALKPERHQSYSLWFQVFFALQNIPSETLDWKGLSASRIQMETQVTKFDLTWDVFEVDGELQGSLLYNTDLFDEATILRIVDHFQVLLAAIVETPEQTVLELPIMTSDEQEQLLKDWSGYQRVNAQPRQLLHQLFEQQVAQSPEQMAVVYQDFAGLQKSLTYQELNLRANQLAHHLQSLGVGPDVLVGLCVERSVEMIIGLLAVLKAGGAYVPLDPHYPQERLAFMLADSQISVLLTQAGWLSVLPETTVPTLCFDRDWPTITQADTQSPDCHSTPENLAYVIYTSGSTGTPKGVMVQHDAVVNFTQAAVSEYEINATDRLLQFASISFDAAAEEIYPCLTTGGTLVLRSDDMLSSVAKFLQTCHEWQLTVLDLPTAYWQQIVVELAAGKLPDSLRLVIIGGERVSPEAVKTWQTVVGNSPRLLNTYGPTEGTVVATAYTITADYRVAQEVPIGSAIANVQTYVLDKYCQPVPIGVPGELHIGGIGVARGYLNRPELTAERFIAHPFSDDAQARLYKTGDLVRYLPDGTLEFLGRIDQQVKIRGFRVELGAIETALMQHPQVQEAVAIARPDKSGSQQLIAYFVGNDTAPTVGTLRSFLKQSLPAYMIPTGFICLEQLPLTPSGKVDRQALPEPDPTQRVLDNQFVAPRNPTEATLSHIWTNLLSLEQVGIHDNFFELGGHSLLATQVISRIQDAFSIQLPLRSLFELPTIAELGANIVARCLEPSDDLGPKNSIEPVQRLGHLPLSPAQKRLWLLNQLEPETIAYTMSRVSRLSGELNIEALEHSLSEIIARHEVLRTTFHEVDGQPSQIIAPPKTLKLPVTDLQALPESDRQAAAERLATEATHQPFDLQQGPLIRTQLLRLTPTDHVLIVDIHHIVFDGWSFSLFFNELSSLYSAFCQGQLSPLPDLKIQYADFANWQHQQSMTADFQTHLDYWKQQLSSPLPLLQLPTDYARPTQQDHRGAYHALTLSNQLTTQLKVLSQKTNSTLFMTLLTALNVLLHRHSGQDDIIVGTPIAGRPRLETEKLIGLFLNSLALRTDLSNSPTFEQLLAQVRETTLNAYAHQDAPFEKLVAELNPERSLARHPIFEVMLNFANLPKTTQDMAGVSLSPMAVGHSDAKFTLTLYVSEQDDQLHLGLVYQQALFTAARMEEFLHQFQQLLEQIVINPYRSIDAYSLVSPTAISALPDPTALLSASHYESVPSIVFNWRERSPEQCAISQGNHHWTYGELVQRAETIAAYLLSQGVKSGDVVATSGLRSFGLIASILGILRAGAVLLLIDPHLPEQRRQTMLTAAQATRLLWVGTETECWSDSLTVDGVNPETANLSALSANVYNSNLYQVTLPTLQPDDPAYIFFTSGTTGTPKGVLGCHKGLAHFLSWQRQTFDIDTTDRVAQLTALSFDVVLRDIFLPLTSGATLCLPSPEADLSASQVLPWLTQQQITVLHTVPTLAKTWLMNRLDGLQLPQLRWVFFAGEPLSSQLVTQWREAFSAAGALVNLYGPTETTLAKCYYQIPNEPAAGIQPIGTPLPETQALIVSRSNQLCVVGEVGEIVLRTPFRTLGYINISEQSQQQFRPNPHRDDADDILYYTGDLGRYGINGTIEILGRADRQVKIRGVRIELGEVETKLTEQDTVREAIVTVHEENGTKYLIAYVVPQKGQTIPVKELRQYLRQQLPAAMVPSAFILLETLPLTPNGKVNKQALPTPDFNQRHQDSAYVAPRTSMEKQLSQIWGDLLNLDGPVGVHDNFFDVGGHSLLATQIVSKIQSNFAVRLPLQVLFETPTIAGLVDIIKQEQQLTTKQQSPTAIAPISRQKRRVKRTSL